MKINAQDFTTTELTEALSKAGNKPVARPDVSGLIGLLSEREIIKVVGTRKSPSGKGKPAATYSFGDTTLGDAMASLAKVLSEVM